LKENMSIVLIGSADEVPKAPTTVQFVEDVAPNEDNADNWLVDLPCGMVNVGNTCYLNATVQCLSKVDELCRALRGLVVIQSQRNASQELIMALSQVFISLHTKPCKGPIVPFDLLQKLRAVNPQFQERTQGGGYCQQDAEECWSTLLAHCHQVLVSPRLLSMSRFPFGDSVVDFLFGIELETVDTCLESHEEEAPRRRREVVRCLKCHISQNTSHLEQGLKEGLETTIELYAESLGKSVLWNRKSRISRLPPYLCVQFVRFFWKATEQVKAKILKNVSFPLRLNMSELLTDELQQSFTSTSNGSLGEDPSHWLDSHYELIAVLTHQGRAADAGHYVAWVRQEEEKDNNNSSRSKWYKLDDDKVSYCTEEDIQRLSGGGDWHMAYLCFYRQRGYSIP